MENRKRFPDTEEERNGSDRRSRSNGVELQRCAIQRLRQFRVIVPFKFPLAFLLLGCTIAAEMNSTSSNGNPEAGSSTSYICSMTSQCKLSSITLCVRVQKEHSMTVAVVFNGNVEWVDPVEIGAGIRGLITGVHPERLPVEIVLQCRQNCVRFCRKYFLAYFAMAFRNHGQQDSTLY